MRAFLASALLIPLLACASAPIAKPEHAAQAKVTASPEGVEALIGTWVITAARSVEGARYAITFFPRGGFSSVLARVTNYRYETIGDTIRFQTEAGETMKAAFAINGDTLIESAGTEIRRLVRHPDYSVTAGIVGHWMGLSDAGQAIIEEYTSDGRIMSAMTIAGEVGGYVISGTEIVFTAQLPRKSIQKTRFRIKGERLTLGTGYLTQEYVKGR